MSGSAGPKRAVKTTELSIALLEALKAERELSLEEISGRFDQSRSTVHRHLATLEKHGIVARRNGTYRLGLRLLDFGKRAQEGNRLYDRCKDFVTSLAVDTGDQAWLSSLESYHSIVVCSVIEDRPFEADFLTGVRRQLHTSTGGLAMLATFDDDTVERVLADQYGAPEDVYRPAAPLWDDLAAIRENGYATRTTTGSGRVASVGTAIETADGCLGAVCIADTSGRSAEDLVDDGYPEIITQAANEMEILFRIPS